MQHAGKRYNPSVLQLISTVVIAVIIVFFLVMSLSTQDLLWFWPSFDYEPVAIIVRCYGNTLEVSPETAAFQELVGALRESLWGMKHWTDLSLSDSTLQLYRDGEDQLVVEFVYDAPIRIHSHFRFFSHVDTLLVPMEGRHAQTNPVFALSQGEPSAGSLHLKSRAPLLDIIEKHGVCP